MKNAPLATALAILIAAGACDPTYLYVEGTVLSNESGRVCIRPNEKHENLPGINEDEPVCGPVKEGEVTNIPPGGCVRAAYENFPDETEKPPLGEELWTSFERRDC